MPPPRVIVTRPAHDAARWVQQLTQAGFKAEALPLIEIAAASDPADTLALQTAWQSLAQYTACMFVSSNAVDYFFNKNRINKPLAPIIRTQAAPDLIANRFDAAVPVSLRFLAPGPGTAAALRALGVEPSQIDSPAPDAAQFDSSALWDVIGTRDWQGARVLVVRGRSQPSSETSVPTAAIEPRDWLTQQLLAAGAAVDAVHVYERRPPLFDPFQTEAARRASTDGSVWLFSSSEAVANLLGAPALAGVDWRAAIAVATHPRILQAVRAAGFGSALTSRPALPEIAQVLRSIE